MKALAVETIYPGHGKPFPLCFALYENQSFTLVDYDVENSAFHHNRSLKHFL